MARDAFQRALIRTTNVRGIEGIVANLHRVDKRMKRELARTTTRNSAETVRLAKSVCPVDTTRMRESITAQVSPRGYTFEVFYDPVPFINDGVPYYPFWVELGTSRMAARPTLRWAYDIQGPIYKQDVAKVLRKVTR